VSGYKSFFDTISYCVVYALVPILLDALHVHIDEFVFFCLPLMLTVTIPLFLIKEGEKYGYPENSGGKTERVSFKESLKLTFKNKLFMRWVLINSFTFIGLNMFLVAMNAMILGGMGFDGLGMAILNTCAFAPVPVMLYLFNKLKAKKGTRFTYQTCVLTFAVSILSFFFASKFVVGENNVGLQYAIGCIGGVMGSWSIGAFFMMPYLVPAQVSSVEEKLTGKNHSAMYFAAQALISSIVSAISGSLIYEWIKMLFISKGASGMVWAESYEEAALKFGVDVSQVFNFGSIIVPFIVSIVCIIGFIWAFKLPRDFSHECVAKELKKSYPDLDIGAVDENMQEEKEEKGEIIFVQIGLTILSGFIFGFIWTAFLFKSIKDWTKKFSNVLYWALCSFLPFVSIFFIVKAFNRVRAELRARGQKAVGNSLVFILLGLIFPVLPVNVVSLALLQKNVNLLYVDENEEAALAAGETVVA
jgi:Na+/melibiose symporter-like transporter